MEPVYPITIAIVDDHQLLRQLWINLFTPLPQYKVVLETGNLEKALVSIRELRPAIVFLDINIPPHSAIDYVPLIRKYAPGTKIIIISMHTEVSYIKQMLKLGAHAYITKTSDGEQVFTAITEVLNNRTFICDTSKTALVARYAVDGTQAAWDTLSRRELDIVKLLVQGLSSGEIAHQLSIAKTTVDVHRRNLLAKLKLKNTPALINYVLSNGLLPFH